MSAAELPAFSTSRFRAEREADWIAFDLLLANADQQAFLEPLDIVVRIRAVQEFTPSQALAPFLELKWVVKQLSIVIHTQSKI